LNGENDLPLASHDDTTPRRRDAKGFGFVSSRLRVVVHAGGKIVIMNAA